MLDNLLKRIGAVEVGRSPLGRWPLMEIDAAQAAALQYDPTMAAGEIVTLAEREKVAISEALRLCKGDRLKAAAGLGISKSTLYRKLTQFGTEA